MTVDYRQFIVDWNSFTRATAASGSVIAALQPDAVEVDDDEDEERQAADGTPLDVTTANTSSPILRARCAEAVLRLRGANGGDAFTGAASILLWSSLDGDQPFELPDADDIDPDSVQTVLAPASVELLAKTWDPTRIAGDRASEPALAYARDWKRILDRAVEQRAGLVEMVYD